MRPSEGISQILNVEREIAVLLSSYTTFEARTLTAYDEFYRQVDDTRIDRHIRFLISKDAQITDKIRHFLQQDPEYPVIVPYGWSNFYQPTDNFILASIRSNYLIRDLFGYQTPLRHEYYFFGRDKLITAVLDDHRSGQNSSLFGLRKSGKTSTIYAIQRRAKAKGHHAVMIDCQDPAVHARNYSELLRFLVNEARTSFNFKPVTWNLEETPDAVSESFRKDMSQTLQQARSDVLLIFDEIENISPKTAASPHWRSGRDTILFWQTLRSFFQREAKYKLTFCFVGTNPHLFETSKINDIANPVYLFAPKTFLQPLTQADVKEMCERLGYFMGLDFDMQVIAHIHQRFGGHPFFTRLLCSRIHQKLPVSRPMAVSLVTSRAAESDGAAAVRNYVQEILDGLGAFYPEEYEMLEYLAKGERDKFRAVADEFPEFVEHAMGYGIITRRGDEHEFLFDAVRDAILHRERGSESIELRRAEVNRRRNKLEEEIRVALFHATKSLTADEWADLCRRCIPKQIDRIGLVGVRELFSKTQSPLYFLDLMAFVTEIGGFFDEKIASKVRSAFDTVNRLRIDAHAKSISDAEYSEWNGSMTLLEDIFLPPA